MKVTEFFVEKYRKIVNVIGTVIVAWLLSALLSQVLAMFIPQADSKKPVKKNDSISSAPSIFNKRQSVNSFMQICERNIFDSEKRTLCVDQVAEKPKDTGPKYDPDAEPEKSNIGAKLIGTMVLSKTSSYATISKKSGGKGSGTHKIGDTFWDEAEIYDIQRNKVFFRRNGKKEYIEVDKLPIFSQNSRKSSRKKTSSAGGIKRNGDKITVSRDKVESTLNDLNKVLQDSRMVPHYKDGQVQGFKIFAIRRGSIFDQLGMKNGDVIQGINGTKIDSLEKALPMLQMIKTETQVDIDMTRRGQKKTLDISIQ